MVSFLLGISIFINIFFGAFLMIYIKLQNDEKIYFKIFSFMWLVGENYEKKQIPKIDKDFWDNDISINDIHD